MDQWTTIVLLNVMPNETNLICSHMIPILPFPSYSSFLLMWAANNLFKSPSCALAGEKQFIKKYYTVFSIQLKNKSDDCIPKQGLQCDLMLKLLLTLWRINYISFTRSQSLQHLPWYQSISVHSFISSHHLEKGLLMFRFKSFNYTFIAKVWKYLFFSPPCSHLRQLPDLSSWELLTWLWLSIVLGGSHTRDHPSPAHLGSSSMKVITAIFDTLFTQC